jgi:hypothetical protein
MMTEGRYRLYLDLCDGGSLDDSMYIRDVDPLSYDPNDHSVLRSLPEAYIWHLFSGLVNASLVLEQGRVDQLVPGLQIS